MSDTQQKEYLHLQELFGEERGATLELFGIVDIDMLTYENIILANMIAPDEKNPPMAWTAIDFFDSDYEKDVSTVIPYSPNDKESYVIRNIVTGEKFEDVSAKTFALDSMSYFVNYLLEKRNNPVLHNLYHSLRALAYSTDFFDEEEQKHFFKLTD